MKVELLKIKDFASVVSGATPKTNIEEYWNGNFNWITPAEIKENDKYINNTFRKVSEEGIKSSSLKLLEKGTVLLTSRAPIGKVAIVGKEMYCNQGFKNIVCNKSIVNPEYIFYWLKNNTDYLNSLGRGATFKEISKSIVENIEVPIYSLDVQNKIVEVLNKSQEIIDKRKKQIEELNLLVKSKFIEMFGDVFLNTKNFEMKQIKDIVTVVKGITYKPNQVNEEGTIVLRSSNIKGNKFDLNDIVRVNKKIDEKFLVEVNDILMCNRNGSERLVGKVAKIPEYNEPMTFGTFMTIIRSPYYNYLFTFFQTEAFRRQIKMQTSVAINQISIPLLESVKVPLPPIELQNKFVDFVKQVDKLKFEIEKSLKELENNFNSLINKAFKGELF